MCQYALVRWPYLRALVIAASVCLVAAPAATASSTVIDTRDDGVTDTVGLFGVPDTATYGQVVTAPVGAQTLSSFTFRVEVPSTLIFRGEVYAWDGTEATGPALFESLARTTSGAAVQDITFDTGATPVASGSQYVLFVSISKDFEISSGTGQFRTRPGPTYAGGDFVYQNDGTTESEWTSTPWENFFVPTDLQFRARFVSTPQALTVTKSGNGAGTVTSSGGGINCGADCGEGYGDGAVVALQANPAPGSVFAGFTGAGCSTSPCVVTMDDAKSVNAQFTSNVVVDNVAPRTTIVKRSDKKVSFKSSESNSTFTCSLDRRKARPCTSPYMFKNLRPGRHTFAVAATDAAGNRDPTPAKVHFTVH